MKAGLSLLGGMALAFSVLVGLTQGNPLAWGMATGFAAPIVALLLLVAARPKPLPRKADPAKIARMEADLGIGDAGERAAQSRERHGCIDPDCPHEHYTVGGFGKRYCVPGEGATFKAKMAEWEGYANVVDSEAPTTVGHRPPAPIPGVENIARPTPQPPAERTTEDCPRPEGCVIAHPCRKCGADKGQACVGDDDLMEMTF